VPSTARFARSLLVVKGCNSETLLLNPYTATDPQGASPDQPERGRLDSAMPPHAAGSIQPSATRRRRCGSRRSRLSPDAVASTAKSPEAKPSTYRPRPSVTVCTLDQPHAVRKTASGAEAGSIGTATGRGWRGGGGRRGANRQRSAPRQALGRFLEVMKPPRERTRRLVQEPQGSNWRNRAFLRISHELVFPQQQRIFGQQQDVGV